MSDLAEKLKIPRTSALVIANKLKKVGLIDCYEKRSHRYWVAASPEKILKKLKDEAFILAGVLPELKSIQRNSVANKPTMRTYAGSKEMHLIFEDILTTKNNFKCIVDWDNLISTFSAGYINDFIETQTQHFLKMDLICFKNEATLLLKANDNKQLRETKFFQKETVLNTATFIYGNKVCIISLNEAFPTGFLIEDPHVSHTMNLFFEQTWQGNS